MTKINSLAGAAAAAALTIGTANAAEISTNTALMQAMDKITGEVSVIEVPVNSEVRFGSFSILVRACKTRPPEETPENFAFVDVVDVTNGKENVNIFKGWMMSSSPALNAIEHPVYDVWLLRCINSENKPQPAPMSEKQLQERDYIEMVRPEAEPTAAALTNETYGDGEPIDLIPADIQDISGEEQAQSEVIKLEAPAEPQTESTPQPQTDLQPKSEPQAAESGPQPLLAIENEQQTEPQAAESAPITAEQPQAEPETKSETQPAPTATEPEPTVPTTEPTEAPNKDAEPATEVAAEVAAETATEAVVATDAPAATEKEQPATAAEVSHEAAVPEAEDKAEAAAAPKTAEPQAAAPTDVPAPAPADEPESDDNEEIIINLENELSSGLLNE